jgi:hypothetical protein
MNTRIKIQGFLFTYKGHFTIRPLTFILFFVLIVLNSCIRIQQPGKNENKTEGYVFDYYSHEKINNAEVQILGWYESWFNPGVYLFTPTDSGHTDANGHFLINYNSKYEGGYSLRVYKDRYFQEETLRGAVNEINSKNIYMFPHGYIKTHITNNIVAARWLEISFDSYLTPSLDIWREGFINTDLLTRAFADTSFITTTMGGMTTKMKILMTPTDYSTDNVVVKDTSFLTLIHDTVRLNIILK